MHPVTLENQFRCTRLYSRSTHALQPPASQLSGKYTSVLFSFVMFIFFFCLKTLCNRRASEGQWRSRSAVSEVKLRQLRLKKDNVAFTPAKPRPKNNRAALCRADTRVSLLSRDTFRFPWIPNFSFKSSVWFAFFIFIFYYYYYQSLLSQLITHNCWTDTKTISLCVFHNSGIFADPKMIRSPNKKKKKNLRRRRRITMYIIL